MRKTAIVCIIATAGLMPLSAYAQDLACLIEGHFSLMGRTIYSKDCIQSDSEDNETKFKRMCEQLANTSAQLGGEPGTVTYMKQCPEQPQGVCAGFLGTKMDAYYYARSAEGLSALPASCAGAGGTWSSGG